MIPPAVRIALYFDRTEWLAAAVRHAGSDVNHVGVATAARAELRAASALGWLAVDERNLLFKHDFVLAAILGDLQGLEISGKILSG